MASRRRGVGQHQSSHKHHRGSTPNNGRQPGSHKPHPTQPGGTTGGDPTSQSGGGTSHGIAHYGVLAGRAIDRRLALARSPHYHIHLVDDKQHYRAAINVQSKVHNQQDPTQSMVEYAVVEDFQHPITKTLSALALGFSAEEKKPGGLALDFIRANLFDRSQMVPLPFDQPGPNNDLNDLIDKYVQQAMSDENAVVYVFGAAWGPETDARNNKPDLFGFTPSRGIHNIHMNQGSVGQFSSENGVWQDGGMIFHLAAENHWVGVFLKFVSQSFHTDDQTGNAISGAESTDPAKTIIPGEPDLLVRIVAARLNPGATAGAAQTITLLNTSPDTQDLAGWKLADQLKHKQTLSGTLASGAAQQIQVSSDLQLDPQGGIITLLNPQGLKVDGISYTAQETATPGWSIVF